MRIVSKSHLPARLRSIIEAIESETQGTLTIIDITSDISVPVYRASLPGKGRTISPVGYGASLYKEYAIERACLETLQDFHLHNSNMEVGDTYVLSLYESLPKFRACILGDIQIPLKKESVEWNEQESTEFCASPEEQLSKLISMISSGGYQAYASELWLSNEGVSCTHVIVPGLEKFNIITSGNPVLPSIRGLEILNIWNNLK